MKQHRKKNKRDISYKLRREFREGLIIGNLIMIILILSSILIYFYFEENSFSVSKTEKAQEIINNCNSSAIVKSAECVNAHIRQFFKYNISNVGKKLGFNELKEQGGVCSNWAELYCDIGKDLGFYTRKVDNILTGYENLTINNKTKEYKTSHVFCLWSNQDAYVVLDQTNIFKFEFDKK
jgi:hypothetical protein